METLDKLNVNNSITVSIWDLEFLEREFLDLIQSIWKEAIKDLVSKYYFLRVSQYLNTKDYKSIEKLEGLLDLYNNIG